MHSFPSFALFLSAVKFDISHRPGVAQALHFGRGKKNNGDDGEDEEIAMKTGPPREWELDVRSLISSKRWLQNYGLKKNRLQLNQILPAIGFKLSDGETTVFQRGLVLGLIYVNEKRIRKRRGFV